MALKMKELMSQTGESKSTILYYIKEGLLPEPSKPKPNVHLYDSSCVQIIKFIKYLQHNFSYSIAEIKTVLENNRFDFDGSFEMIIDSLSLISGGKSEEIYTEERFLQLTDIDKKTLHAYLQKGYLFESESGYGNKEVEIVGILKRAEELGLDFTLLNRYVEDARYLAKQENEVGKKLLSSDTESHNARYELLFDLVLTLKPYIFNTHTIKAHQEGLH
jgi:DNA-binding transcriptional MerR regulator